MRRLATAVALLTLVLAGPSHARPAAPSGAGRTFTANGVTIWYEVRGAARGTPLVVCNGGPGFDHTYELCSDAWDTLAVHRPVVFWDQRGTGRSTPWREGLPCKLADQIADLEALRIELHAPKLDLLGHSWGGYLVMAYNAVHPASVAHLLIVDSAAPKLGDTEFMFRNFVPEKLERQARFDFLDTVRDTAAFARSLHEYLGWLFVSTAKRDEFVAMSPAFRFSRGTNEALTADLNGIDMWPALPEFRCPTLVLTGRYDINVAPSTAWKIHRAIPGSRFAVFEESGHLPFFEEPRAFVKTLEEFLGGAIDLIDSPTTGQPPRR
jgi:proline iminopeptidase